MKSARHPFYLNALEFAERIAIMDASGAYSYSKLWEASASVAHGLLAHFGVDDLAEEPIAFLARPGFQYVALQWGIWRAGGIAAPLGVMHPQSEWTFVLADTRARLCVFTSGFAASVDQDQHSATTWLELSTLAANGERLPEIAGSRKAMILYTSGTTSRPKGVVLTHDNIRAQVDCLIEAWEWSGQDHILHVLPLHHVHGLVNALACPLSIGATCEFARFDARAIWNRWAMPAGTLNLFMAVPTIYAKLIAEYDAADEAQRTIWTQAARDRFRLMVSGSAALPVNVLKKWESITGHRLLERYGMTEIGMALSNPLQGERIPGCVGRPLPGVELRLAGESGNLPADGEPGEIQVRGPNVFNAYWKRSEATAQSFTEDGWFKTGDIAACESGVYRILGRSSVDIIKTGGYKVSALEIEEVLRRHDAVQNCAVVGITDDTWGEIVAAAIVGTRQLDVDALLDWSKQQLAPYKVPHRTIVLDELPTNAMGKVTKPAIKGLFEIA